MTILNLATLLVCAAGIGAVVYEAARMLIEGVTKTETESPVVVVIERMYDNAAKMCSTPQEANTIMLAMHTGPVLLDLLEALPHERLMEFSDERLHQVFMNCCFAALRNQRAPRDATLN